MTTVENERKERQINGLFDAIERNGGDWLNGRKDVSELMAHLLTRWVNGGCDTKTFTDAFSLEHRTLQQAVFSLFLTLCKNITTWEEYMFDGRNEAMRDTAKKIMDTLGYSALPLI